MLRSSISVMRIPQERSERKSVVLIDDILYNGRTIRAALDVLFDFGRQEKVMHCVLIDRRFTRLLSIQTDYIGKSIDAIVSQKVKVFWKNKDGKDEVCLVNDQFFFFSIYISLIYITPFSYSFLIEKATQFRSVAIKFFGENPKQLFGYQKKS